MRLSRSTPFRLLVAVGCVATSYVSGASFAAKPAVAPTPPPPPPADPARVDTLAGLLEQMRWGMSHLEVAKVHNQPGGIIDRDYDPQLTQMQPGLGMQQVEAEREAKKVAFLQSFTEFKDTPTGYDHTGIKDEFTYRNKESLMYLDRAGKRRYFFFFGAPPKERLWKFYDEVPLKEDGPMGQTFVEAVTRAQSAFKVPGRLRMPDPAQGLSFATVDWQDQSTHLRYLDRSLTTVGVVLEDRATLDRLAMLRPNKQEDPLAMDPTISAITQGTERVDPNAERPAPPPPPKGRKK